MRYSTTAEIIEGFLPRPIRYQKDRVSFFVSKLSSRFFLLLSSKRLLLLRWGIPILVILSAAPLGFLAGQMGEDDPLLALPLIGLFFIPVVLIIVHKNINRFEWSPVYILTLAIFSPIELPTGTASVLVDSLLIALIFTGHWIFTMILVERRYMLQPSPLNTPFWGFTFITMFSLVWSMAFNDPLVQFKGSFPVVQLGSAMVNIMLPGTLFLVTNHVNHIKQLKTMVILMMVGGFFGFISRYGGFPLRIAEMNLINDNGFFTMWTATLGVALFIFNKELALKWRIAALLIGGSLQLFRFIQDIAWLAGWLPGFISLGILIFIRSRALLLFCIGILVLYIIANSAMFAETLEAENEESGESRLHAWETNWKLNQNHLLFGTGQAAYINYYLTYKLHGNTQVQATHNTILDILSQNGIFGLFFCFWMFSTLSLLNFKVFIRFQGRGDFAEALAGACFAGTIASSISMAFGDWMFPFAYTQSIAGYDYIVYSWLFMGTGLALDKVVPREEENQSKSHFSEDSPTETIHQSHKNVRNKQIVYS